jgi:hypothetical protein
MISHSTFAITVLVNKFYSLCDSYELLFQK